MLLSSVVRHVCTTETQQNNNHHVIAIREIETLLPPPLHDDHSNDYSNARKRTKQTKDLLCVDSSRMTVLDLEVFSFNR